jgi:hypothetical protein
MVNVSTELILAVVAAVTGTTTFLGVVLICFVYFLHRRKRQQNEEEQSNTNSRGNSSIKQSSASINTKTLNMLQQKQDQGNKSDTKCTRSDENKSDDDDDINLHANGDSIPNLIIQGICPGSNRSGTVARGHHRPSSNQKDHQLSNNDNKKKISFAGISLPIGFGLTAGNTARKDTSTINNGTHRVDIPNGNDTDNSGVSKSFGRNDVSVSKKTSKGTILQPQPKRKGETVDASNIANHPKIRRFSSSSSSSSSSLSYAPSPRINEFSFNQTQNSSVGHFNDDDSQDIHTFDDNWSYAMVSKVR